MGIGAYGGMGLGVMHVEMTVPVTSTSKLYVPAAVGVPIRVADTKDSPGGAEVVEKLVAVKPGDVSGAE